MYSVLGMEWDLHVYLEWVHVYWQHSLVTGTHHTHAHTHTPDILLLFKDEYREPTSPKPTKRQTTPPSIPITTLYPNGDYPKGMEVPYTVSTVLDLQNVRYM